MSYTTNFSIRIDDDSKYSTQIDKMWGQNESDTMGMLKNIDDITLYHSIKNSIMDLVYKEHYFRFIDNLTERCSGGIPFTIKNMKIDDYEGYVIINFGLYGTSENYEQLIKNLFSDNEIKLLFVGCELGGVIYKK